MNFHSGTDLKYGIWHSVQQEYKREMKIDWSAQLHNTLVSPINMHIKFHVHVIGKTLYSCACVTVGFSRLAVSHDRLLRKTYGFKQSLRDTVFFSI